MVGLHVADNQIVGCASVEGGVEVGLPFGLLACIGSIENGNLVVDNHIGVVGYTIGNDVLTFEEVGIVVVNSDISHGIADCYVVCHTYKITYNFEIRFAGVKLQFYYELLPKQVR